MGWFGEKAKRERKRMETYMKYASGKSIEEAESMKARASAGFESNLAVLGMFGQPGTYGPGATGGALPGSPTTGGEAGKSGTGSLGIFDVESDRAQVSPEAKQFWGLTGPREGVLDPKGFSQYVSGTKPFQIISGQVAEAQGLTDPQSPFRQTLEQSVKNPILEGGAEIMRESMRTIKNAAAKGGTARRTALQEAQQMLAIERSNRAVSQQLWQANLQFENWIRDYQRNTVNAAMAFTEGLGVQRYVETMNRASEFMVSTALPAGAKYQQAAYEAAAKNKKASLGAMLVGAVVSIAGTYIGMPGLGSAIGLGGDPDMAQGGGLSVDFDVMGQRAGELGGLLGLGGSATPTPGTPGGGVGVPLPEGGYAAGGGFLP